MVGVTTSQILTVFCVFLVTKADDGQAINIGRFCCSNFVGRQHRTIFMKHERQNMSELAHEDTANFQFAFSAD